MPLMYQYQRFFCSMWARLQWQHCCISVLELVLGWCHSLKRRTERKQRVWQKRIFLILSGWLFSILLPRFFWCLESAMVPQPMPRSLGILKLWLRRSLLWFSSKKLLRKDYGWLLDWSPCQVSCCRLKEQTAFISLMVLYWWLWPLSVGVLKITVPESYHQRAPIKLLC